jgi:hypothetical protein
MRRFSKRYPRGAVVALTVFAALLSLSLSACNGGGTSGSTVPSAGTVQVTAINGAGPISGLDVTLTRSTWPNGQLITSGTTNASGQVTLSGSWTNQDVICVGASYGSIDRSHCEQPLSQTVTLDF